VRDDLGVRLRDERVPFLLKLALQVEVVLDDAVVDDDDAAGAVAMRVRIFLGRTSVGRPARVADAVVPVERVAGQHFFQTRELAGASPQLDRAVAHDGDARRVIPPVLEPAESVDQNWKDLLVADVSDDPAHADNPRGAMRDARCAITSSSCSSRPSRPC
jgi:hypothetical protein